MEAITLHMLRKYVQHVKMLREDKTFKILVVLGLVVISLLFVLAVVLLTKPFVSVPITLYANLFPRQATFVTYPEMPVTSMATLRSLLTISMHQIARDGLASPLYAYSLSCLLCLVIPVRDCAYSLRLCTSTYIHTFFSVR